MITFELIDQLQNLLKNDRLGSVKRQIQKIREDINSFDNEFIIHSNGETDKISKSYLIKELNQVYETRTIERTRYYIKRLIKSLSQRKECKINDINLNRWKEYDDILTDSLWVLDKRDRTGVHNAGYWGNFIPQIPNQLLRRYTRRSDTYFSDLTFCRL